MQWWEVSVHEQGTVMLEDVGPVLERALLLIAYCMTSRFHVIHRVEVRIC